MVIKVYISGSSGNKEVKKRQQRVLLILDSKNVKYEVIDIAEPGAEESKDFMQNNSTSLGVTIGDPNPRHALPPQIFNDEVYCGDYDMFDMANECDTMEAFLKLEPNSLNEQISTTEIILKNGDLLIDEKINKIAAATEDEDIENKVPINQEKEQENGTEEIEKKEKEKSVEQEEREKSVESDKREKSVESDKREKSVESDKREKSVESDKREKSVDKEEREKSVEKSEEEKGVEKSEREKSIEKEEEKLEEEEEKERKQDSDAGGDKSEKENSPEKSE